VEVNLERLRQVQFDGVVTATLTLSSTEIGEVLSPADLVIGAVLVSGARAPIGADDIQVGSMRQGSVRVDLGIDQGGCIEASHPTSLSNPVYEEAGTIHYYVTNVPGSFCTPRSASRALSAAITPRVRQLAVDPNHPMLAGSLDDANGRIVHSVVVAALDTSVSAI